MNSGPLASTSQTSKRLRYKLATELVFIDNSDGIKDPYNAASVPIYQSATFKQSSATQVGEYDYSRSGNPTRSHLGECLATTLRILLDIYNKHQFIHKSSAVKTFIALCCSWVHTVQVSGIL
jgi:cystathionine beta-lyase/cystathionine gamma-synthase